MALKKEDILKANDLKTIDVDVPEWGGSVKIRTMTGEARQAFQDAIATPKGKGQKNTLAALVASCCVDDSGELLFCTEDISVLGKKSAKSLLRVWQAAAELNGLTDTAIDDIAKK